MKIFSLVILFFATFYSNAQTSVYHPFPDSAAVWNIHYDQFFCAFGYGNENYSITFSGDTQINSQAYHKLNTPFVQSLSTGNCPSVVMAGYRGAIRQDSINKKVYFIPPANLTEQLLYDFNMQVGDTVRGYIETNAPTPDTVIAIDSVLVGSSYRKRWEINSWYNIYFIEGIGSTYGLIVPSMGYVTDQPSYTISCFQQNAQTLYPNTTSNCQVIDNVNSTIIISDQVIVFPNPSNGFFTIDIGKMEIEEIRLTDLLGHLILQLKTPGQTKFNIDNLQSGTYILTIIDKNNNTTNRKIISCP